MPPLLVLAVIGAGTYMGVRWIRKKTRQFTKNLEKAAQANRHSKQAQSSRHDPSPKNISELKKDPVTGVYRVEED